MTTPFIALTLPAMGGIPARPIFVNALNIREVSEVWARKPNVIGKPEPSDFDIVGTYITTGSGEDGTYTVTESYGEVTSAIRDALA